MKTLNEYLNTNPNKNVYSTFTKYIDFNATIKVLEANGFKEIDLKNKRYQEASQEMAVLAEKVNYPIYYIYPNILKDQHDNDTTFIRFCKCGKITKDNPIYLLRFTLDNKVPYYDPSITKGFCTMIYFDEDHFLRETNLLTYENFLRETKNYFN